MRFGRVSNHISHVALLFLVALGLMSTGCGKAPPPIIAAGGIITLDGKPLPNAEVRFMPMQDGLDGNYVASAISDADGAFILKLPGKSESGCCACLCKVLVVEGPVPDKLRKAHEDGTDTGAMRRYQTSLPNRPIPDTYGRIGSTPLSFEVSEENHEFAVELKR